MSSNSTAIEHTLVDLENKSAGGAAPPALSPAHDPHKWAPRKKWTNLSVIALQATISPVCSAILATAALQIDTELHIANANVSALPVALYVLGLGLGPLYLAPLSEMYGRRAIYVVSFALFSLLNVGCALVHNAAGLIVLRFLTGLAGSAGTTLGGGTIADMFEPQERGGAQALYGLGPTFGPALGGLIGGYIAERAGWRWQMWVMAIAGGATTCMSVLFLQETYAPYIVARAEGRRSAVPTTGFAHALLRPLRMLLFAPIATTMSVYMSVIYGVLYLHIVTIPLLFGPVPLYGLFTYGWSTGNEGLAYLGAGLGCYVSIFTCFFTLNRSYRALCRKYGAQRPEYRLPMMQLGMLIVPGGLFMYGWSAQAHAHFMVPLVGAGIFAFGMLITYICIQTYMVDAFGQYAASAVAATIVLRSIFGAVFSIFGTQLYAHLDYGWGTSVLAFITIAALPLPYVFWVYGERLRSRPFIM